VLPARLPPGRGDIPADKAYTIRTADLLDFVAASATVVDAVAEHGLVHTLVAAVALGVTARTLPLAYSTQHQRPGLCDGL